MSRLFCLSLFFCWGMIARAQSAPDASNELLRCGSVRENLKGGPSEMIVFPLEVKPNLRRLTLRIEGGQGDADLYLRQAEPPTLQDYDDRPYVTGNEEEITLEFPMAGTWYVMVHGYRAFEEVRLSVMCFDMLESERVFMPGGGAGVELSLYYELADEWQKKEVVSPDLKFQQLNAEGREAFQEGRYDDAMAAWSRWAELEPDNPRPRSLVGDLYLRGEELDKALEAYRHSLEIQPGQLSLMVRVARILDQQADRPEEARALINTYMRLFPNSSDVVLAGGEWLIRRRRYREAREVIQTVIANDPVNLNAMTMYHSLLQFPLQRYENMQQMLQIGSMPGRESELGLAVTRHNLLTEPESWVLMNFIDRMAGQAASLSERNLFYDLLPRQKISEEDFRIGRLSTNWISSREETWGKDGRLTIRAEENQTEAFLRLDRSDAMTSGYIEAEVDDTRGFFWIYARRGGGNFIRFGFEQDGNLYLQIWMNGYLVSNQTRVWSRPLGIATLRLEVRGDGAKGFVNGNPAFSSPVTIPASMGLGWWGIAPWSAKYGTAEVSVRQISGGPLPIRLALIPNLEGSGLNPVRTVAHSDSVLPVLNEISPHLNTLAPEWYRLDEENNPQRIARSRDMETRLLSRYHRIRFLPMIRVTDPGALPFDTLSKVAERDRLDGFTLVVDRMPGPEWVKQAEMFSVKSGMTLHVVLIDNRQKNVLFREFCSNVGIFAGPRSVRELSLREVTGVNEIEFSVRNPNMLLWIDPE